MIENLLADLAATSRLEMVSVAFGLIYVVLAARENIWCWPAALIGTGTAVFLFWDASLLMESALNVFYIFMAFYGYFFWQFSNKTEMSIDEEKKLVITSLGMKGHVFAIGSVIGISLISGFVLRDISTAVLPFVDSFTTWGAVVTTWMVARKILENWLYWIAIDGISVWLFLERGLALYALLFVLYTVIAVYGYWQWRKKYLCQPLI